MKKEKSILIIGYGMVGKHLFKEFPEADILDPYQNMYAKENFEYDYAFVSVPTEMKEDGSCDTSIVEDVITNTNAKIYIIKSTIIPGTTDKLKEKLRKKTCIFTRILCSNTKWSTCSRFYNSRWRCSRYK